MVLFWRSKSTPRGVIFGGYYFWLRAPSAPMYLLGVGLYLVGRSPTPGWWVIFGGGFLFGEGGCIWGVGYRVSSYHPNVVVEHIFHKLRSHHPYDWPMHSSGFGLGLDHSFSLLPRKVQSTSRNVVFTNCAVIVILGGASFRRGLVEVKTDARNSARMRARR